MPNELPPSIQNTIPTVALQTAKNAIGNFRLISFYISAKTGVSSFLKRATSCFSKAFSFIRGSVRKLLKKQDVQEANKNINGPLVKQTVTLNTTTLSKKD